MNVFPKQFIFLIIAVLVFTIGVNIVFAANTGNTSGYAWSETVGWLRFDGTDSAYDYGVSVPFGDGEVLTGYAWSENAGWVHFSGSCDEAGGCPDSEDTYGAVSTKAGCSVGFSCLSGYAWGEGAGWLRFAADSSTYANDSTTTYGVYIDASGDFQGYAWGEQVGWVHFSGSCDEAGGCPDSEDTYGVRTTTSTTAFTVSVWLRPTNSIASKALAVKDEAIRLITDGSGKAACQIHNGTVWQTAATSTAALALNSWQYVSCTYDRSNIKVYVNAVLQATQATANVDVHNATSTLDLGYDAGGTYGDYQGYIDEFKYYKYARTAAQIKSDFTGVSTPRGATARSVTVGEQRDASEGLVAYWKMDESSGNAADSSGNSLTLTNNNATAFAAGKFGNAADFTPASLHYFSTVTSVANVKTVEFWVYPDSTTNNYFDLASGVYLTSSGGTLTATGFASPTIYVNGVQSSTISASAWSHIAVVSNIGITANAIALGKVNSNYFDGKMDDIKIYNTSRTAEQIWKDYETGPPPVAHWKMDENSGLTAYDVSGNANNGTLTNGPTWTNGKYGSALSFDGSNDYVNVGTAVQANLSALSVCMWFNTTMEAGSTYNRSLVDKWDYGLAKRVFNVYQAKTTNKLAFMTSGTGAYVAGNIVQSQSAYNDGSWHHACAVYDNVYNRIYIDGNLNASTDRATDGIYNTIIPILLGNGQMNGIPDPNAWFDGLLDDVRIYNYARTPKQIYEDMNAGHPAVGSPVGSYAGYWKFDEMQGTTAYDQSLHQNNLTLSAASWTTSTDCKFGGCWQGASNRRLTRADDPDFDFTATEDFSVSVWFKRDTVSNQEYLVHKQAGFEGYALSLDASGDVIFGIGDTSSTAFPEESIGNIGRDYDDNNWHHAVAVKTSNSRIDLYVDGVLIASDTSLSTGDSLANSGKLIIGDQDEADGTDEFLGNIDEVAIYRFALSPAEIKLLYNQGASLALGAKSTASDGATPSQAASREYCVPGDTSQCDPPVGHWKMDEKTGLSAYDTSGNGNTGTLTNGPLWKSSASCHTGSCLSFDGSNDYVSCGEVSLAGKSAFSISTWVKLDVINDVQKFVEKSQIGTDYPEYSFEVLNTNKVRFWFSTANSSAGWGTPPVSSNSLAANIWYHLVGTYDGSNIRIFINGALDPNFPVARTGTPYDNNDATWIGSSPMTATNSPLDGQIDDVRIYNYARTPAQIAWDFNRGAPIAHWKMDEGQDTATTCDATGLTVYDSIGSNDGTLSLTPAGNTDPATARVEGKYSCAIDFDGTDDYVDIGDLAIDYNLRSISFWLNPDSTTETIMDLDGVYTIDVFSGAVDLNGTTTETIYVDGIQTTTLTTGWHNVVITIPDTEAIDPDNMDLGRAGGVYLDGMLDDVRLYTYPLTPLQIKQVFNEGSAVRFGPASGLP